uniref:Uncharacterized protein n=1 Tax=viral metagenome TaxID=1070528 RepID=A0A6M3L257_9ZZZZ
MKIVKFEGHNVIYAKDQPEYQPLPVLKFEDGKVISCWKLSFIEKIKVLFTGKIWLSVLTFNHPLQPLLLEVKRPFKLNK